MAFLKRPPLKVQTSTLWEYPSQHYDSPRGRMQGDKDYAGATPSWIIWQLLTRYTRVGDRVLDPMCGSGTTLDVCTDLGRVGVGFDLAPARSDIGRADARTIPLTEASVDFAFVDPPYSTHVDYSDDPRCIGKLDASGADGGEAYYAAMDQVFGELFRVLKDRRYAAVYVSDSWRRRTGEKGGGNGIFMPIGFELFALLRRRFQPVDIICVVRHNASMAKANYHKAAEEGNFFLRGFSYLLLVKKVNAAKPGSGAGSGARPAARRRGPSTRG